MNTFFSPGDTVTVRSDLKVSSRKTYCMANGEDACYATDDMIELGGRQVTISRVEANRYRIHELGYYWTDEMFVEYVEPFTKEYEIPQLGILFGDKITLS